MTSGDTTITFVLGLISAIFILIISIIFIIGGIVALPMSGGGSIFALGWGVFGIVDAILLLVGSLMVRNPANAKSGAILVLIFGILGFFTPLFGIIIFPILSIVGGALGLGSAGETSQPSIPPPRSLSAAPPAAVKYAKEQKAAGYKISEIKVALTEAGYTDAEISASLKKAKGGD